jgi:uncharacterized protein YggU (UPF0235/DUF167 family)
MLDNTPLSLGSQVEANNTPLSLQDKIANIRLALEDAKKAHLDAKKASIKIELLDKIAELQDELKKLEPTTPKDKSDKKDKESSIELSKHNDILSRELITVGGLPIGAVFFVKTILKNGSTKVYKAQKTTESYGSSAVLAEKNKSRTCGCSLIGESGAKNFTNNQAIIGIEVEGTYFPVEGGAAHRIITYLNFQILISESESIIESGKYGSSNKAIELANIKNCEKLQESFELQYANLFNNKFPKSWNLPTNNWAESIESGNFWLDKFPLPTNEDDANLQVETPANLEVEVPAKITTNKGGKK